MATILVVDDEKDIRSLLRRILEEEGHCVLEAGNGAEAVGLNRRVRADLVILDILMPVEDGMEATWQLTHEFPGVKIIAMTGGQGDMNFLDAAKILGAHRTIQKPFDVEHMLQLVRDEMAQRERKASGLRPRAFSSAAEAKAAVWSDSRLQRDSRSGHGRLPALP